jgi:hypothetical protein
MPETVEWTGASGKKYTYWVYALPANINAGQDGNYIYTRVDNGRWQPIYIGQGDLGQRTDIDQHHQSTCLKRKGVTHVHAHNNGREADRLAEETDLLKNYPQAYRPRGCNEMLGG